MKLDVIMLRNDELPEAGVIAGQTGFCSLEQELAFKLMITKHFEEDDVWVESSTAEMAALYLDAKREKARRGQRGFDARVRGVDGKEQKISVKSRSLRSIRRSGRGGKLGYNPNCTHLEFYIAGHNFVIRVANIETQELLEHSVQEGPKTQYPKNMKCFPRKVFSSTFEQAVDLAERLDGRTLESVFGDDDLMSALEGHRVFPVSANPKS